MIWCAGYWRQFDATAWDADDFARHVEVNLLGLNNVLAAVVPAMVAAGRGHLVGIASVAGYRGLAGAEAYGATKAAQINLLEALRGALPRARGPRDHRLPGFVRTEMTESNDFPMPFIIDADEAARAIADGIERGDRDRLSTVDGGPDEDRAPGAGPPLGDRDAAGQSSHSLSADGLRKTRPRGGGDPGARRRPGSRSTASTAVSVSRRLRCIPRQMCGPLAKARWRRALDRRTSNSSGDSKTAGSRPAPASDTVTRSPCRTHGPGRRRGWRSGRPRAAASRRRHPGSRHPARPGRRRHREGATATRSTPRWPGRTPERTGSHLVDLDAAFGRGSNRDVLERVIARRWTCRSNCPAASATTRASTGRCRPAAPG